MSTLRHENGAGSAWRFLGTTNHEFQSEGTNHVSSAGSGLGRRNRIGSVGRGSAALAAQPDEALVKPVTTTFEITGSGTAEGQGTEVLNINSAGTFVGTYLDSSSVHHAFIRTSAGVDTSFDDPSAGTG